MAYLDVSQQKLNYLNACSLRFAVYGKVVDSRNSL